MDPLRAGDPREVGGYRLEWRLGGGGMGQVFLGRTRGGHPVAVKVIHPHLAADPLVRRRLADEVKAASRVAGTYTAEVIKAGLDADPPWLATAYIPALSLEQVVTKWGPMPADAVGELGAGLAEALAAIHACDLVHRDLKPGNVLLADGPRIIDFGIARALDATSYTAAGTVVGTAAYMSPEQVRGRRVGPCSDVFSLAAVLTFAATGRRPFGDGPHQAMMHRILNENPDVTGLPVHLADLLGSCLSKDPDGRPDARGILDTLPSPTGALPQWLGQHAVAQHQVQAARSPAVHPSVAETDEFEERRREKTSVLDDVMTIAPDRGKLVSAGLRRMLWAGIIVAALFVVFSVWTATKLDAEQALAAIAVPIVAAWCVAVTGTLKGLFERRDILTMDREKLTVAHNRWVFTWEVSSIPWDEMRRISVVGSDSDARLVAWLSRDNDQHVSDRTEAYHGGRVLAQPAQVLGSSEPGKLLLDQIRTALADFAGDKYVNRKPVRMIIDGVAHVWGEDGIVCQIHGQDCSMGSEFPPDEEAARR